ncbi:nitrous oxide reductase accessory protein NosL [Paracoccus sp. (in: a-proteobacteria)]|uniref:nitrous oxide reductase accessory protein NosL n=1 Tax=Paracoccus sp. TaxID=267 RepID=UPI003A838BC0
MRYAAALLILLAACRQEVTQSTAPVPMTADAVGHYCQMNLLEHDGPKAQVHLEGLPGMPLFFSQVRDAVAYARLPEQSHPILAIWVSDMGAPGATWGEPGAENWIDAQAAFYVVGSTRQGGMGAPELVPFGKAGDARGFAAVHGGQVLRLDAIPDDAVIMPAAGPDADDSDFQRRLKALSDQAGG